jgi:hypothetical protein
MAEALVSFRLIKSGGRDKVIYKFHMHLNGITLLKQGTVYVSPSIFS